MNHNIYFIYGLPGSGKTTYSIELHQEHTHSYITLIKSHG